MSGPRGTRFDPGEVSKYIRAGTLTKMKEKGEDNGEKNTKSVQSQNERG